MKKFTIAILSVLCFSFGLFGQGGFLITDLDTHEEDQTTWLEDGWGSGGRFIARDLTDDTPDESANAIQIDIDYAAGGWGSAWGYWPNVLIDTLAGLDASGYEFFSCYLKSTVEGAALDVWFEYFDEETPRNNFINSVTITGIGTEWAYFERPLHIDSVSTLRAGKHDMTNVNRMSFGGPPDLGETYSIYIDQLRLINEPGEGVWTKPIVSISGVSSQKQLNLKNYPNPFNSSTSIKYNLEQAGNVVLKIYNVSGQELETLVNDFQIAGEHEVTWVPNNVPGGIYLCTMQSGNSSETIKLVVE